jgi:tetratricopeptide (TPR) repeat protein
LLAAAGALAGAWLGDHAYALLGAAIGGITGAFAPSLLNWLQDRTTARRNLVDVTAVLGQTGSSASLAGLLNPDAQVVPFTGRGAVLTSLVDWCEDQGACPVALITGAGGQGKTRLAIELCDRLTGWQCEWVGDGQEAVAVQAISAVRRGEVLLVVDYAEARIGLRKLLRDVAIQRDPTMRVLLLARSAGDWWETARIGDSGVRALLSETVSIELSTSVDSGLSDSDLVRHAVPHFAARLGQPLPPFVTITGGSVGRRILDLHAAALIAVIEHRSTVDLSTALAELLEHERRTWLGSAIASGMLDGPHGMTVNTLGDIVAAGALLGAASKDEAVEMLRRIPDAIASVKVATWLRDLYPPDPSGAESEWLGSLRPDRLAERLVAAQLERSPEFAAACLTQLDARQARRALSVLGRASEESPLRFLDTLLDEVAVDVVAPTETLIAIIGAIPADREDVLTRAGATVARRIFESMSATASPEERGEWLRAYARRLEQLGLRAEALTAEREVIALYRQHAKPYKHRSMAFRSWLGKELEAYIRMLLDNDELAEALSIAQEQVAIWQAEFPAPDRHIAEGLNDLATVLVRMDRLQAALSAAEQAAAQWRDCGPAYLRVCADEYLFSLIQQAEILIRLHRRGEAQSIVSEIMTFYAKHSRNGDERLVFPLRRLAVVLLDLDHKAAALEIGQAVIAIVRNHTDRDFVKYGQWAVKILGGFSEVLAGRDDAGQIRDAVNAQAIDIARQLTVVDNKNSPLLDRLLRSQAAKHAGPG